MTAQEEVSVIEELVGLAGAETHERLRAASAETIERLLGCSRNQAEAVLKDLEDRKLIDATITPGGALDARKPMPVAEWMWVRPSAEI